MRLATIRDGSRDGRLIVVRSDARAYAEAGHVARSLQQALEEWPRVEPMLKTLATALERGTVSEKQLDLKQLAAPLPRAYEWVDGSAYLNHIVLVRKARGAEPPDTLRSDPLVYQGGTSEMLGPHDDITLRDPTWGLDFESEVCVVLGDTPIGTTKGRAPEFVRLVMLANDITLRNLIPPELAKGFGFFQSKPATAFSPFAVTPDELGDAWRDGRVHLRLRTTYNGKLVGDPEAGPEMHFSFFDLIAHITKTRSFTAGTIVGSGTVSNADRARGISCLAERRMIETLEQGKPVTPFMNVGDTVEIEMLDAKARSIFGRIAQRVVVGRT